MSATDMDQPAAWVAEFVGAQPPRFIAVSDRLGQLISIEDISLAIRFADEQSCQRVCDSVCSGATKFAAPVLRNMDGELATADAA